MKGGGFWMKGEASPFFLYVFLVESKKEAIFAASLEWPFVGSRRPYIWERRFRAQMNAFFVSQGLAVEDDRRTGTYVFFVS